MPTTTPKDPTQAHLSLQDSNTILIPKGFFVQVEGGSFMMGKENDVSGHKVTVKDFHIARYPVTQALWEEVMGSNPSNFKGSERPVENVSLRDAQNFCQKLSQATGFSYRLPTEAEWEYAARGGKKSEGYKYAGSNNLHEVGWYYNNSHQETKPVGLKMPNELGLYDMCGNVWEWCGSLYKPYPYKADDGREDLTGGGDCVCRGGAWYFNAHYCRLAYRFYNGPHIRSNYVGFRLVAAPV